MKKIRDLWRAATLFEKLTLIFSLLYVFAPIDFVPEAIFGPFGIFDDATALGAFIWTLRAVQKRLKDSPNYDNANDHQTPKNLIP